MRSPQVCPSASVFQASSVHAGQPQCVDTLNEICDGAAVAIVVVVLEHLVGSHAGPQIVGNSYPATRVHASDSVG
jgi:hypothetical protein